MNETLANILSAIATSKGRVVALTGAGISAESGIPTFRGRDGFWTVGSREYHPQEMATNAMFQRQPEAVWPWYLYRRSVCRQAAPNPAHLALVDLEAGFEDRFVLVTQNVDGLHLRAGNTLARTWQIHGNIDYMRCSADCSTDLYRIPDGLDPWARDQGWDAATQRQLVCPRCGLMSRPHVLWFDEYYDEEHYRFESSLRATADADLLLIVGTAGATNLPNQMARLAAARSIPIVDINPDDNPFAQLAGRTGGFAARGTAGDQLPAMVDRLLGR